MMEEFRTLYKYKSLANFDFVADIILNKRFYAAQFFDLNDPMEGLFSYSLNEKDEYIEAIVKKKQELRICSFSTHPDNILMWAHYADGFKGICFEVKIREHTNPNRRGIDVNYDMKQLNCSELAFRLPSFIVAHAALLRKNKAWRYESEVRILSAEKYIKEGVEITGIILGLRTPDTLKQSILKLTAGTLIEVWNSRMDEDHNKIIKGDKLIG